jgi:hypothetical protein
LFVFLTPFLTLFNSTHHYSLLQTIGKDSKTARIFKAIHQGIVHCCTYQLKAKVTSDILTGDVRGPEGWFVSTKKREKKRD